MKQSSQDIAFAVALMLIALVMLVSSKFHNVLGFSLMIMSVFAWILSIVSSHKESMEVES